MYKFLIKPVLFLFPAERAHYLATGLLKFMLSIPGLSALLRSMYVVEDARLETECFGLRFPNPVGLAAGFDKQASMYSSLRHLGFGFIEIGTITPKAQEGNPRPRLFRLPKDKALINRMGFNNLGLDEAIKRLKDRPQGLIIGGNIGKNKITPNEEAVKDYETCFLGLFDHVDYFVVNVSSPNTPNLRDLQEKEPLKALLNRLMELNRLQPSTKPILLKIAPDLSNNQLDDVIEIVKETGIQGIIATNTTIAREGLNTPSSELDRIGAGGLSGEPLRKRSTEVIRYLNDQSGGSIPIIGVGGINTGKDAADKLEAGACLVQVYTGFIYEGPGMIARINRFLLGKKSA